MHQPYKRNFKVYQGSTFQETLRWEDSEIVYVPITSIIKSAPLTVITDGHSIPSGWRVKFNNIVGMVELNSDTYHTVTEVTAENIIVNAVNSLGYKDYISGGVIEYYAPVSLANTTARMQIRNKLTDEVVVHELTTENSGIVTDDTAKTITLTIPADTTSEFSFKVAVYSIELVTAGTVVPFCNGMLTLVKEVTR